MIGLQIATQGYGGPVSGLDIATQGYVSLVKVMTLDLFKLQVEAKAPNRQVEAKSPNRQIEWAG